MSELASVWIGIDNGTSACKVVAVDEDGRVVADSLHHYPMATPRPGWAEQDPADWWSGADQGVRDVLAAVGDRPVRGFGLCGQMHGLTALDGDGEVLRSAILWNDQRAAPQCDEITERAGGLRGLLELTQNRMLPGFTGGKLLWLRQHEPETFGRMRHMLNPKDYLRLRMTGEHVTEVSDASGTGLFDVRNRRWSTKLLELLDLPEELLPRVVESAEVTGGLSAEVAALLAGVGTGNWASLEEATAAVQETGRIAPDTAVAGTYDALHGIHRQLFTALDPTFAELAALDAP